MSAVLTLPYRKLRQLIEQEHLEPTLGWGLRMAVATTVPVVWGISTGHQDVAQWVALAANNICWVALKGTYAQRFRMLAGGIVLTFFFGIFGSVTGSSLWLSVLGMMATAFLSGLFKNLGDRGSGLSICLFVMYLITNTVPLQGADALEHRALYILIGGIWTLLIGIAASLFLPLQQPYRRTIAIIWQANAALIATIAKGWDGKATRSSQRDIYLKEKEVRNAIDQSLLFHERTAHQVTEKKGSEEYKLAQSRKAASLVATHIIAANDEIENLRLHYTDATLRLKLYDVFNSMQQVTKRIGIYAVSLRLEEASLVRLRLERLRTAMQVATEHKAAAAPDVSRAVRRILQVCERIVKLLEKSLERLKSMKDEPLYRSYAPFRTMMALHPKHLLRNLHTLVSGNSHMMRYAVRTAVAAGITIFIAKQFMIPRGYWLTLTVIIILQPYFGATFRKAVDRVIGTLLGGLAGGLVLLLPEALHVKEVLFFASGVAMICFFRQRYAIATFFITLNVVLLLNVSASLNEHVLLIRAVCTLGGAALAVIVAFVIFPAWDRKWLPRFIAASVHHNYDYFTATFFDSMPEGGWIRCRRQAETANGNAYDSFNRYMQEPGRSHKMYSIYYQVITHNVRITRELNNVQLERENGNNAALQQIPAERETMIWACMEKMNHCAALSHRLYSREPITLTGAQSVPQPTFPVTRYGMLYLERMLVELRGLEAGLEQLTAH